LEIPRVVSQLIFAMNEDQSDQESDDQGTPLDSAVAAGWFEEAVTDHLAVRRVKSRFLCFRAKLAARLTS
jgi:hypothetical protein